MSYSVLYSIDKWVEKKLGRPLEINILDNIQTYLLIKPEEPIKLNINKHFDHRNKNTSLIQCNEENCNNFFIEEGSWDLTNEWELCETCEGRFCQLHFNYFEEEFQLCDNCMSNQAQLLFS